MRKYVVTACAVGEVLLLVGMFVVGRLSKPDIPAKTIIEEKVKLVEVIKEVVVVQEKIKVEKIYLESVKESIHRQEHQISHPNGLVETFKSEDINVDRVVKESDIKFVDREVTKETVKYQDREVIKEVVINAGRPSWRISPLIGVDLSKSWLPTSFDDVTYGISVSRRIIGPIDIGVWGLKSKQFGISLGMEL